MNLHRLKTNYLLFVFTVFILCMLIDSPNTFSANAKTNLSNSCVVLDRNADFSSDILWNSQKQKIENRVALVIGNGAYEDNVFVQLVNPIHDAMAVSLKLQELGFKVIRGIDLSTSGTKKCLNQFHESLETADASLFYYAGHGAQANDHNYLVPSDATIQDGNAVGFFQVDNILDHMRDRTGTSLVFLDACRDNGTSGTVTAIAGEKVRSIGKGLAPFNLLKNNLDRNLKTQEGKEAKGGILLAFATSPNQMAQDGGEDHSPFTQAFLDNVGKSGYPVERVMSSITNHVGEATGWHQTPWMRSSLTKPFYFNGDIDIESLIAISKNQANLSEANLKKGERKKAIAAALQGFPKHFNEDNKTHFLNAYEALYKAMTSNVIILPLGDEMLAATLSQDRKLLVTASLITNIPNRRVTLWDVDSRKEIAVVGRGGHKGAISGWALRSDGKHLVTISSDGVLETWDTTSGQLISSWNARSRNTSSSINGPQYSPDNSKIVTIGENNTIFVWEAETGNLIAEIGNKKEKVEPPNLKNLDFLKTPGGYEKAMERIQSEMFKSIRIFGYPKFTPDGSGVSAAIMNGADSSGGGPASIVIWDIKTKRQIKAFNGLSAMSDYTFSKDGGYLVAGSESSTAYLWDGHTGKILHRWDHDYPLEFIAIRPEGNLVVTYPFKNPVRYWDPRKGVEVKEIPIEERMPYRALFSNNGVELMLLKPEGNQSWEKGPVGQALLDESIKQIDEVQKNALQSERIRYRPL